MERGATARHDEGGRGATSVAAELVALLERARPALGSTRVRALHLSPIDALDSLASEFCALEIEGGALGLSFVRLDGLHARLVGHPAVAGLAGRDALEVARGFGSESDVERTLGFAAINALSRRLFDRAGYRAPGSPDSLGVLSPQPGDHVGMIGLFRRLVPRLVASGARVTVVELREEVVGEFEGYRVTTDAGALAGCNKILSTSTLLLNGTLDRMLAACAGAQLFAMVGPGASCLPDPLFARGVALLGGTWVDDGPALCRALRAGESWEALAHKVAVHRDTYPGFEVLLARARGA